jgi:hypothetical protein
VGSIAHHARSLCRQVTGLEALTWQSVLHCPAVQVLRVSLLYETLAMYLTEQPAYLNAAVLARTDVSPLQLLYHLKQIEKAAGDALDYNHHHQQQQQHWHTSSSSIGAPAAAALVHQHDHHKPSCLSRYAAAGITSYAILPRLLIQRQRPELQLGTSLLLPP